MYQQTSYKVFKTYFFFFQKWNNSDWKYVRVKRLKHNWVEKPDYIIEKTMLKEEWKVHQIHKSLLILKEFGFKWHLRNLWTANSENIWKNCVEHSFSHFFIVVISWSALSSPKIFLQWTPNRWNSDDANWGCVVDEILLNPHPTPNFFANLLSCRKIPTLSWWKLELLETWCLTLFLRQLR